MNTCLVTGAAGFIGSHMCSALADRGWGVIGIDNFDRMYDRATKEANLTAAARPSFEFHEADIRDGDVLRGIMEHHACEYLVHIAALAGVRPSTLEPDRYVSVNVGGTLSLLEAARAAGCRRVLYASSSSVYGNECEQPFCEDAPITSPVSPYAATKRAGELMCESWCERHGMAAAMIRFFTVYGPRQRPDLAITRFFRAIADGRSIDMFGDGRTTRDYTWIEDIIAGVLAAIDRIGEPGWHRTWNLGSGRPVLLRDMIAMVSEIVGRDAVVETKLIPPGDVDHTFADLTRSRAELGYEPSTPLEEGLRRQWDWMQARAAS